MFQRVTVGHPTAWFVIVTILGVLVIVVPAAGWLTTQLEEAEQIRKGNR